MKSEFTAAALAALPFSRRSPEPSATSVVETSADVGPLPEPTPTASEDANETLNALAAEAKTHYDNAQKAQRDGDWAEYGDEMKALGEVIERMDAARTKP